MVINSKDTNGDEAFHAEIRQRNVAAASLADDSVTAAFWVMELIWFQHKTATKRRPKQRVKRLLGKIS